MTYHEIGLGIDPTILYQLGIGQIDILAITLSFYFGIILGYKWFRGLTWKQVLAR